MPLAAHSDHRYVETIQGPEPMRILLVDDERTHLQVLSRALARHRPEWQLELASGGRQAVALLHQSTFDVLVTDIGMPDMDGMSLLAEVRSDPGMKALQIIFATALDDRGSMRAGMTAGADDYLTKPFSAEELAAAIESRLKRLVRDPGSAEVASVQAEVRDKLTEREVEVLAHIGRGLGSKEIAAALGISPRTVDVHRTNLMRKVDLHNAASLATLAMRAGLV